jgi:hypothetical protein
MKKYFLTIQVLILLLLLSASDASANSGPPPERIWLLFQDESGTSLPPQGLQLVGCSTEACTEKTLLLSYGKCNLPGCLPGKPTMTGEWDKLACDGSVCRAVSYDFPTRIFQLISQANGQVYTSPPAQLAGAERTFDNFAYQAVVSPQGLSLTSKPDFDEPKYPLHKINFLLALLITLVSELLVAGLYGWFVLRWREPELDLLLVLVGLADLITLPMVWFFFPSFAKFMPVESRSLGIFLALIAIIYTSVLYYAFVRADGRRRRNMVTISTLIVLLATPVCSGVIIFVQGYTNLYKLTSTGLPGSWLLLMSEIFAWLYETFFLYFLSRKTLPLKHALILSLLMNLTSFLAGLVILTS